jgi:hypothetical protein
MYIPEIKRDLNLIFPLAGFKNSIEHVNNFTEESKK